MFDCIKVTRCSARMPEIRTHLERSAPNAKGRYAPVFFAHYPVFCGLEFCAAENGCPTAEMGHSRRLSDVGMSASPPTTDGSLRLSEPTLWAIRRHCGQLTWQRFDSFVIKRSISVSDFFRIDCRHLVWHRGRASSPKPVSGRYEEVQNDRAHRREKTPDRIARWVKHQN
jgi:hypothetical protein